MLSEIVYAKINKVSTQEDFDDLLNDFKLSEAPLDLRNEAIRELKANKPQFDEIDKLPTQDLFDEMKDGESDISDMGGFS